MAVEIGPWLFLLLFLGLDPLLLLLLALEQLLLLLEPLLHLVLDLLLFLLKPLFLLVFELLVLGRSSNLSLGHSFSGAVPLDRHEKSATEVCTH